MAFSLSFVIQRKGLDRDKDFKFFGLIINESINIFIKGHLKVFATFLEASLSIKCCLLLIEDGKRF